MGKPATESKPAPTEASASVAARPCFPAWLLALLLALVTIVAYWPATHHDFVNYDDNVYVTSNVHVQGGLTWENVKWAFLNPVSANWHPVTMLSHMLDCQLFGLEPWGHHLTSLLLHALNTVLVFLLLYQMTGLRSAASAPRAGALWRSVLVAALFGLHPLHVESVAWVAERKDVLSCFFFLLTLLAYTRYAQKRSALNSSAFASGSGATAPKRSEGGQLSTLNYFLAIFFFALGLMSKPMLVTLPFVMLLLDYWPLQRVTGDKWQVTRVKQLVLEKIPFFALAAAASVVTFVTQKQGGTVITAENLPLGARAVNALISCCRYLGKMFWPADLAVYYPHPGYWPWEEVLLAGVFLCGISALLFVKRGRYPFLLVGWLWFIGTLVPVMGLVQVGGQAMADRYTYIPSLGVLILVIWGAYELAGRWRYHEIALAVAGLAAIVLCISVTRQQLGYWQDSETLFRHALKVTENNPVAHKTLGDALLDEGQTREAVSQYQEAIRLKPDDTLVHNNLGSALFKKGQTDEAISEYQEVIRLKPDYAEAHYNLGIALLKKGQTDEAINQYREAIRLKPDYAEARYNLGLALLKIGQTDGAISQFQEAIRLKPDDADAHNNLGNALLKKGQTDGAISQFQEVIRLKPGDAVAHYNLGNALFSRGQTDGAISQFREAIRLKPDDAEAHYNIGVALLNRGQTDGAISQFQEAIRLNPDYADARYNLGVALLNKGQADGAISQFQEVIRLNPDAADAQSNLVMALELKNKSNARTSDPIKP